VLTGDKARKYNVGMVLAHQYLGQLEPKLQEAFAANTAIKFAGGVSAKDARTLAPMLYTEAGLIEAQGKGSFAAHVRGETKGAVPLTFPFGYLESLPVMSADDRREQREAMRVRYAVHHSAIGVNDDEEIVEPGDDSAERGRPPKSQQNRHKNKPARATEDNPPVPPKGSSNEDNGGPRSGRIDTSPGEGW